MDLYQRQQFDFMLATAVERFCVRLQERFRGVEAALERIQADPNGDDVGLGPFIDAFFEDFLLNTPEGACFVLQALARRQWIGTSNGSVEEVLVATAKKLFSELVLAKTTEMLEQRCRYQSVNYP
ncbi:MAG TPA: hypothetical protein ENJ16_02075 [Planctomycetaceae bacterium]|nr:hypothetical protein [Planctomycetaceae bacterium]